MLVFFLLSRGFYRFREIQKKYTKKIEKIINLVIIYYYNDCSSSDCKGTFRVMLSKF